MGTSLSLLLRLGVSLVVVLLLVKAAAGVLQRTGGGAPRRRGPAQLEVLARQPLGRRAAIGVVRAGDRALVLGITDQAVTLLAEDAVEALVPTIPEAPRTAPRGGSGGAAPRPTWTTAIDALRDRTTRRR